MPPIPANALIVAAAGSVERLQPNGVGNDHGIPFRIIKFRRRWIARRGGIIDAEELPVMIELDGLPPPSAAKAIGPEAMQKKGDDWKR